MVGASRHAASDDDDGEEMWPSKRQKVAAACDQCRVKKVKCDGNRPVCAPCNLRGGSFAMCEWTLRRGRGAAALTKDRILQLTQRIEELEAERYVPPAAGVAGHSVTATAQSMAALDTNVAEPIARIEPAVQSPTLTPRRVDLAGPADQQALSASPVPSLARNDHDHGQISSIESNAMMGFVGNMDRTTPQLYIDSSMTSFMNQIKRLVDRETSDSQTSPASSAGSLAQRTQNRKSSRGRALFKYDLPSRQRADHLLSVHRRLVSTLYPFLDFAEIESLYIRLWTGVDLGPNGLTFVCLINLVFGLACNLDTSIPPQQRISDAEVFYNRANELLQLDIVYEPSLLLVQCLLLMGLYLQSSDDPERCWISVGFAIRVAQSLRIDIFATSAHEPVHHRELMRRVWHGCILMDQILSMTFGRPSMISSQASVSIPLPLPHPDGTRCECANELGTDFINYHFYVETLRLYHLMNETLSLLYSAEANSREDSSRNFPGLSRAKMVGSLLEMDEKLASWYHDLPTHLRRDVLSDRHLARERQSNILVIRYSHVRILLFRPIFAWYCSNDRMQPASSNVEEDHVFGKVVLQLAVACVKMALNLIESFDAIVAGREVEELDDLLPAWWYSIFYVYTAAAVLVAARLNGSICGELTEQAISESWVKAMRILNQFEIFGEHAKRCSSALRLLSDLVNQQTRQTTGSQETPSATSISSSVAPRDHDQETPTDSPSTVGTGIHTQNWWSRGKEFAQLSERTPTVENLLRHFNTSGIQVDIFGNKPWMTGMPSRRY